MNRGARRSSQDKVRHDYHDHSKDLGTEPSFGPAVAMGMGTASSKRAGGSMDPDPLQHMTFPVRLHYALSDLEKLGLVHVASWAPHGRCFVVHDREEFVRLVLSRWFAQKSFASFQRQLNIYGFKRLTAGLDKGGYYHELFLKEMVWLSYGINRMKVKNNGCRKPAAPENEPNFYEMDPVPRRQEKNSSSVTSPSSKGHNLVSLSSLINESFSGFPTDNDRQERSRNEMTTEGAQTEMRFDTPFPHSPSVDAMCRTGLFQDEGQQQPQEERREYMASLLEPIGEFYEF